jgi:ribosome-associated translation inhibitor RaiA
MEVQVTTDNNIQGSASRNEWMGSEINSKLSRFAEHVMKVDVHLADESGPKDTPGDKRCILQANVKGRPSIVSNHHADTVEEAFNGSVTKLKAALASFVDQLKEH